MQQTLLALCALLAFSLYALGRHRADAQTERDAVGGEVELMVTEQARALLTRVVALPFDEADIGATLPRTTTAGLSIVLGPESGEAATTGFDDADDYNGYTGPVTATWDGGTAASTQALTATVVVRYVQPTNPSAASASPTLAKEVAVTITEATTAQGRVPARATLRQVITPSMR